MHKRHATGAASVAIITELSDKRRCMRWHNWRLQYDVCHRRSRRRRLATGEISGVQCGWQARELMCHLGEMLLTLRDLCAHCWQLPKMSCQTRRKVSETVETVSAVSNCSSSSSICGDPTTSGPDGIISNGVANFSAQPDETEHEIGLLGSLSRCYDALCHYLAVGAARELRLH